MTQVLFLDVETSGLPLFHEPSDDPRQPHIVELAALLVSGAGKTLLVYEELSQPFDWEIPKEATAIHGITTDEALQKGRSETEVVGVFMSILERADVLVGHNIDFEKRMLRIALKRYFPEASALQERLKTFPTFCTMRQSTEHCRLPPTEKMMASGRRGFKSPTLVEAYKHFTSKDLANAHRALPDCDACKEVYFAIQNYAAPTMHKAG